MTETAGTETTEATEAKATEAEATETEATEAEATEAEATEATEAAAAETTAAAAPATRTDSFSSIVRSRRSAAVRRPWFGCGGCPVAAISTRRPHLEAYFPNRCTSS